MKKWLIGGLAVAVIFGLFWVAPAYNALLPLNINIDLKTADLAAQYQRRADLVPNIVASVKGETEFEKGTLVEVTEARAKATSVQLTPEVLKDPKAMEAYQANQATLSGALGRLLVAAEKYPELRANSAFKDLRVTLEEAENRIKYARFELNKAVAAFNNKQQVFPTNIISGFAGMHARVYFEADKGSSSAPQVKFN